MNRAEWHVYQVLTKRPARARRFVARNPALFGELDFDPTGIHWVIVGGRERDPAPPHGR